MIPPCCRVFKPLTELNCRNEECCLHSQTSRSGKNALFPAFETSDDGLDSRVFHLRQWASSCLHISHLICKTFLCAVSITSPDWSDILCKVWIAADLAVVCQLSHVLQIWPKCSSPETINHFFSGCVPASIRNLPISLKIVSFKILGPKHFSASGVNRLNPKESFFFGIFGHPGFQLCQYKEK